MPLIKNTKNRRNDFPWKMPKIEIKEEKPDDDDDVIIIDSVPNRRKSPINVPPKRAPNLSHRKNPNEHFVIPRLVNNNLQYPRPPASLNERLWNPPSFQNYPSSSSPVYVESEEPQQRNEPMQFHWPQKTEETFYGIRESREKSPIDHLDFVPPTRHQSERPIKRERDAFDEYGYQAPPLLRYQDHHSEEPRRYQRKRKPRGPDTIPYTPPKRHEIPLDHYSDDDELCVLKEPAPLRIVHPIPVTSLSYMTPNLSAIAESVECEMTLLLDDVLSTCEHRNVELRGSAEQIARAREVLDDHVLADQEHKQRNSGKFNRAVLFVPLPARARGAIIKKHREGLKQIANSAGACIVEVSRSDEPSPPILLRGNPAAVERAKTALNKQIEKVLAEQPDELNEELRVARRHVGKILGRRGAQIRELRSSSGVRKCSFLPEIPGNKYRVLELAGTKEQIEKFKMLAELVTNQDAPVDTDEGIFKIELTESQIRRLLERGGVRMREIRDTSGAKVMLQGREVTVSGEKKKADLARHLVYVHVGEIDSRAPYTDWSHLNNLSKVQPEIRSRSGTLIRRGSNS